jgi:hypothetical protein
MPIKIASVIVALWAGYFWLVTFSQVLAPPDEAPWGLVWLLPIFAIANTVAVVIMSKMNKPKATATVVEAKFRAGPLIRLMLIGVLISGSVIYFVILVITAPVD